MFEYLTAWGKEDSLPFVPTGDPIGPGQGKEDLNDRKERKMVMNKIRQSFCIFHFICCNGGGCTHGCTASQRRRDEKSCSKIENFAA